MSDVRESATQAVVASQVDSIRLSSETAVVASRVDSIRLSSMRVVVATPTSSALRLSSMRVVIARRAKDTVFTLEGSYGGTDAFGPSRGSGTLTIRR